MGGHSNLILNSLSKRGEPSQDISLTNEKLYMSNRVFYLCRHNNLILNLLSKRDESSQDIPLTCEKLYISNRVSYLIDILATKFHAWSASTVRNILPHVN